jgi:hypothetical protein
MEVVGIGSITAFDGKSPTIYSFSWFGAMTANRKVVLLGNYEAIVIFQLP